MNALLRGVAAVGDQNHHQDAHGPRARSGNVADRHAGITVAGRARAGAAKLPQPGMRLMIRRPRGSRGSRAVSSDTLLDEWRTFGQVPADYDGHGRRRPGCAQSIAAVWGRRSRSEQAAVVLLNDFRGSVLGRITIGTYDLRQATAGGRRWARAAPRTDGAGARPASTDK